MRLAAGRRRIVVMLGVCIALGAFANALVAAWCVYGVSTRERFVYEGRWPHAGHEYAVSLMVAPGKAMAYWALAEEPRGLLDVARRNDIPFELDPDRAVAPGVRPERWATTGDARIAARLAEFPPVQTAAALGYVERSRRCDVAYGWPCLSFRGGFNVLADDKGVEYDFGVELPMIETRDAGQVIVTMSEPRVLPLIPIVPGLAANTGVYGAAWWVLLFGPGVVRRALRRRRGRCAECGYDRRGLGADAACPECGAAPSAAAHAKLPAPPPCAGSSDQGAP